MSCVNPVRIQSPLLSHKNKFIYVPCGKCAWCRKDKRNEWYLRFKLEMENNQFTKFVTLTYSDDQLPFYLDEETGEFGYRADKSDVQKFIKRMRKAGYQFKYFIVSEYAPKTRRPHYHGLFFSDDNIKDEVVRKHWQKGVTDTQDAEEGCLKYVTKYILKGNDRDGNFKLQSTRPAIGSNYINSKNAKHTYRKNEDDGIYQFSLPMNGTIYPMPRYFRKKFKQFFDELDFEQNQVKLLTAMEERPKQYYLEKKFQKSYSNEKLTSTLEYQQKLDESIKHKYFLDNKEQLNINNKSKI